MCNSQLPSAAGVRRAGIAVLSRPFEVYKSMGYKAMAWGARTGFGERVGGTEAEQSTDGSQGVCIYERRERTGTECRSEVKWIVAGPWRSERGT